jgi:methionine sulfoxide reductase heme-binding subunit
VAIIMGRSASKQRSSGGGRLSALGLGVGLGIVCLVPFLLAGGEEGIRASLRASARVSFAFWLSTFIATPLVVLWPGRVSKSLKAWRPRTGLVFAGTHGVHGVLIGLLLATPGHRPVTPLVLVFGSIGFFFIAAMAVTTFPKPARAIGPAGWRRLHTAGTWFIALVFAVDFLLKPSRFTEIAIGPFAAALALALVLRVSAMTRKVLTRAPARTAN